MNDFDESLGASIVQTACDAGKHALERFATDAVLALGQAAMALVQQQLTTGATSLGETLVKTCATDVVGHVVSDFDENGLDLGDVHVTANLAKFAAGDPSVRAPITEISAEHCFAFALAATDGLEATGKLTLHGACALDDPTQRIKPSAWAKVELALTWSSQPKETGAAAP
jgi:hypothetical protein